MNPAEHSNYIIAVIILVMANILLIVYNYKTKKFRR